MKFTYYQNSPSGFHCVQACLQTMLHYFSKPVLSLEELDQLTDHIPGDYTWMTKSLIWISSLGLKVKHIENLDYNKFASEGKEYLKQIWNTETFETQEKYSDLIKEQRNAKLLINEPLIELEYGRCGVIDIKKYFTQGYFIMLSINPYTLKKQKGYGSHLVVVSDINDSGVQLCDPDQGFIWYSNKEIDLSISKENKPDFSITLVYC